MARSNSEARAVNARIVYWGIEGAGKSANLRSIHAKLRPDHRGELRTVPTPVDPTTSYNVLPIELGELGGVQTRIEIVAVPGAPEQAPTRKQLLDRADGVVFVVDASADRIDDNVASFEELRTSLGAYGRSLEDVPLVIQHNKEDLADPYALEELHRKLDVHGAAVFAAVAREGSGVLQTLTTISKRVIRTLRQAAPVTPVTEPRPEVAPAPLPEAPAEPVLAQPESRSPALASSLEEAALALEDDAGAVDPESSLGSQAERAFRETWEEATSPESLANAELLGDDWSLASVGPARRTGARSLRVPLVIADELGRRFRFALDLRLDPDSDEDQN